jgi:hypothetical protein
LVVGEGQLSFVVRRWSFLGAGLPRRLAPRGRSFEFEAEGCFRFHVEIAVPFVGLIVNYSGYLRQARKE